VAASVRLIPSDSDAVPDATGALAARDELERAFRRLPADQRAVLVLHHYLGYPLTEVASTLEIPVGTARSRLHYAIRQLRAAVEADARLPNPRERTA
jgi:RNA polymerase sigma-70 factor, ECF subfamily